MAESVSKQLLSAEGRDKRNPQNKTSNKTSHVNLLEKPRSSKSVATSKLNCKKTKKLSLTPSSSTSSIVSNTSTSRNTEANKVNKNFSGTSPNRKRLLNILLPQNSTTEDDTEEETTATKKLKRRRRNFSSSTSSISSLQTNSTIVSSEPTIKAVILQANSSADSSSSNSTTSSPSLKLEIVKPDLIAHRTRSRTQSTDRGASDKSSPKNRSLNYFVSGLLVTDDDSEDEQELKNSDKKTVVASVDKKTNRKVQGHNKAVASVNELKVISKVKQDTSYNLNSASSTSSTSSDKQKVVIAKITSSKKQRTEELALEEELNTFRSLRSASSTGQSLAKKSIKYAPVSLASSSTTQLPPKKRQKVDQSLKTQQPESGVSKSSNLGARLVRSSGREPQLNTENTSLIQAQQQPGQPLNLLRRSFRGKSSSLSAITGSCVSSSSSNSTSTRSTNRSHHKSSNKHGASDASFDPSEPSTSQAAMASDGTRSGGGGSGNNNNEQSSNSTPFLKFHRSTNVGSTPATNKAEPEIASIYVPSSSSGIQSVGAASGITSQHLASNLGALNVGNLASGTSVVPPASAGNPADSESDDSEVGRLQALLEARGLPPHLFSALGPRMHHLLHRTMGASSSSKAQQLLQGLQCQDESQQLQAAIEMCEMLVMGNEDTLAGFPIKQVVPALINLLRMEHNFDIMNNACRALAYMLEALPRSSGTVVDAIPAFLEKLQVIQCMDVAEQSLTALEILSRRHNKSIMQANGVSACLTYLDFFSINAQHAALAITANCCLNLHAEEFHFVKDSLPLLARLLAQQDKKSVERICNAFYRLVDSFQHDAIILQEIASMELLKNCQQLLVVTPAVLNTVTFVNVIRMLSVMCANCPDLAITLLKNDIASTLLYLLTNSVEPSAGDVELVARSPPELFEITCLIGELMPRLPNDGIFSVDALLERASNFNTQEALQWQWRDDRGIWRPYSAIDSRMIEAAHLNSDDEISLSTLGRTYTIDFHSMQQINEDSGTTRSVQRKINTSIMNIDPSAVHAPNDVYASPGMVNLAARPPNATRDARIACLKEERGLAAEFIKNLFSVLYEVYSSSAGPSVRYKCLRALLRMVYFANADLLKEVLKNQLVSSHIAGMMASNDLRIVSGALQMAEILMQKLPEVFGVHFRREGVMHQINLLADPAIPICAAPSPKSSTLGGALSAPSSANTSGNFDFDSTCIASTSKGSGTHVKNLNSALSCKIGHLSMPSTSGSLLNAPHLPSTSSTTPSFPINLNTSNSSNLQVAESSMLSQSAPVAAPNNGNMLLNAMYAAENQQQHTSRNYHPQSLQHGTHYVPTTTDVSTLVSFSTTTNEAVAGASGNTDRTLKVSDILKRKVPPKRKSQNNSKSKNRTEDAGTSSQAATSAAHSSSGLQEFISKATNLGGTSGRSTPSSSSAASRSRFAGASSKTTSFLASLNPSRWGRTTSSHATFAKDTANLSKSVSNSNLIAAGNREKARQWIRDQSISFVNRYSDLENAGTQHPALSILSRLTCAIQKLDGNSNDCLLALQELRNILIESDISPFEVNHSGLIKAMISFMSNENGVVARNDRLRAFLHVFAGISLDGNFSGPLSINPTPFSAFVAKLNACVTQLEQFPVKVHDFPAGVGGRSNTSALKFFNTHQLKCNLQRHPECTNLRQWKGGTVKIDPLALVQAIERYLVVRGYGGIRIDSEEDSEEDIDNIDTAVMISMGGMKHKLQFMIADHILPYNMTVYQAIRQYSPQVTDQSETDTDTETPIGSASIWVQQHTIYYRPVEESIAGASSKAIPSTVTASTFNSSRKANSKSSNPKLMSRRKPEFWIDGTAPVIVSPLTPFLVPKLPNIVTVDDASLDVLALLRILNALNRYWSCLYFSVPHVHISNQNEFIHSKIAAKAGRQLQDPLVIMTGNLPTWLQEISASCPFLFPFETRHLLFYAISFDRDRALQRLIDTTPDLNSADTSERVTPRLDRRKRAISRDDILKQAEVIIQDFAHSKALLEIQYENEVGTGLGPTLEFYALVSTELQRCDLALWNDSDSYKHQQIADVVKSGLNQIQDDDINCHPPSSQQQPSTPASHYQLIFQQQQQQTSVEMVNNNANNNASDINVMGINMLIEQSSENNNQQLRHVDTSSVVTQTSNATSNQYVNAPLGLFPLSLSKTAKTSQISRQKFKFKFLGKFMAKAVMDSRMLDLPFSIPFYRWLLTEENSLSLADLGQVAPEVQCTLLRLNEMVKQRDLIQSDPTIDAMDKTEKIESLDLDGCLISDLGLDFVLPGYPNIELRRGGRDIPVTIHNLHQYISLVSHWFLIEGVSRQFESLREGFNSVFPTHHLRIFYPEELENVFCGSGVSNYQRWDNRMLADCCRTDHGFSQDSKVIQQFFDILSQYSRDEQRLFLQFVTGSPRLPTGGFKALSPPLTIVRKKMDGNQNPDEYLPSVMTCVNYLKLPDYSNREVMKAKLKIAANEGSMSFHLS